MALSVYDITNTGTKNLLEVERQARHVFLLSIFWSRQFGLLYDAASYQLMPFSKASWQAAFGGRASLSGSNRRLERETRKYTGKPYIVAEVVKVELCASVSREATWALYGRSIVLTVGLSDGDYGRVLDMSARHCVQSRLLLLSADDVEAMNIARVGASRVGVGLIFNRNITGGRATGRMMSRTTKCNNGSFVALLIYLMIFLAYLLMSRAWWDVTHCAPTCRWGKRNVRSWPDLDM